MSKTRMLSYRALVVSVAVAVSSLFAGAAGCKSNSIASTTNDNASGLIGPQGGIVSLDDGTAVRIPAGALTKDTMISIHVADTYPHLQSPYTFVSKVYSFEPHGLKFNTSAIIEIHFAAGGQNLVALHADPDGAWGEAPATIGATTGDISTPGFSFYALASTTQGEAGGPSCSGRGPDNGAPKATTMTGFSGTMPAGQLPPVMLSAMVDGYAVGAPGQSVELVFTPYASACGYYANQLVKIGSLGVSIYIFQPVMPQQSYTGMNIFASASGVGPTVPRGACNLNGTIGGTPPNSMGTGVTITAIDSTHVAGSFSFDPGTGAIAGTFDLPFCQIHPGLDPKGCCE